MNEEQKAESKEGATKETATEQPTEYKAEDIEALLSVLEKSNVKNPQQLQGHLTNARDYHKIQSERDTLANELRKMQDKLDTLNRPQQHNDEWGEQTSQYGQPLNLKAEFLDALRTYETMKHEEQMRLQQQQLEAYDAINNDPNYQQVKDVWEAKLRDPRFLAEINSGRKHPVDAYKDIVIENQKLMLSKTADVLKALHGRQPVATPHVEQTVKGGVPPEEPTNRNQELLKKVRAEVDRGRRLTEDEELALLDAALSGK